MNQALDPAHVKGTAKYDQQRKGVIENTGLHHATETFAGLTFLCKDYYFDEETGSVQGLS